MGLSVTKCRCTHGVPWFWTCLNCKDDRDRRGWGDVCFAWDGVKPITLKAMQVFDENARAELERRMLECPQYPVWACVVRDA